MLIETCHYFNFTFIDIVHSIVNFDCDFTLLPSATNIHYNFQTKKDIGSYQFYVSFVGETFFLETCANFKLLPISIVILPCYLVQQIPIIAFRLEKRSWVINFMSVLLVKHFFSETCANFKVLPISIVMLPCHLLQ